MSHAELGVTIASGVLVASGLLTCFLGRRLLRVVLGIVGFVAGAAVAGTWAWRELSPLAGAILALVGGAVGAAIAILAWFVGVFLLGASAGVSVAWYATGHDPRASLAQAAFVVAALVGGVLALVLERTIVIVLTALLGAAWAVTGGAILVAEGAAAWLAERAGGLGDPLEVEGALPPSLAGMSGFLLAAWLALAILGMLVQARASRRRAPEVPS